MRDPARTVVVTGVGVLCHLGDDLSRIEAALRDGRGLPFVRHPPAVEAGSRCQLLGSYRGELTAERRQARFMGRAALMAYKATLMALAQSGLAGGVEVADDHFHAGFDAMRAFNGQDNEHPARASRPYARDRAGFIFGEGAGMVVLETKADAEARGAEVLGVLAGYGMSSDGTGDMVCPTADGALMAMEIGRAHV